jgi:hypothetical protein
MAGMVGADQHFLAGDRRAVDRPLPAHRVADAPRRRIGSPMLDLDHFRPHIGEDHRAERPGEGAGQIDYADTRQRQGDTCLATGLNLSTKLPPTVARLRSLAQ